VSTATFARIALVTILGILSVVSLRQRPVPLAELKRRLPRCVIGLACFGVGIAFFVQSKLGTAPWDVLHEGLSERTGLDFGLIINVVGLLVLPLWIPLKERIGLGTVLNTLEIGIVLDLVRPYAPAPDAMFIRIGYVMIGTLIVAVGSGLYIGSGLGAGPRDGIMMGLRRLGLSVRMARTIIEITTMIIGVLLGGTVGLGTAVFLISIGPLVQFFLARLSLPPLPVRPD
jgi:uncharacterized membrane protein YczE